MACGLSNMMAPRRRAYSRVARRYGRSPVVGSSRIAERRATETIKGGISLTSFMKFGDRVHIEMLDAAGRSIFGAIDQAVEQA
jgi:hypothetical protein